MWIFHIFIKNIMNFEYFLKKQSEIDAESEQENDSLTELNSEDEWDPDSETPPPLPEDTKDKSPKHLSSEAGSQEVVEEGVAENTSPERSFPELEKMSEKEASKKLLSEERTELARYIKQERAKNRDKILELKTRLSLLENSLSQEQIDLEYSESNLRELKELRVEQANTFMGRLKTIGEKIGINTTLSEIDEKISDSEFRAQSARERIEMAKEEKLNLENLLDSDTSLQEIKKRLEEHYARAGELSEQEYERQRRSIQQVCARNNAFILHGVETMSREMRPHETSPVSEKATLENELDILMALEPSISTSSFRTGTNARLFGNRTFGVILGGGDVKSAHGGTATVPRSIKERSSIADNLSSEEIDEKIKGHVSGFNELNVDNPKIFGVFKRVEEKNGTFVIAEEEKLKDFNEHLTLAEQRGLPQFVLTPENRIFEYLSVDELCRVSVGSEVNPLDVANRGSGVTNEDRKKAGSRVINSYVFDNIRHHKEAKEIVGGLSGEENSQELSRWEYLENLYANPEKAWNRLNDYPEELKSDPSFIKEVMEIPSLHVVGFLGKMHDFAGGRKLLEDPEFIRSVYDKVKPEKGRRPDILHKVPEKILNKDLLIYGIEHSDSLRGVLKEEHLSDPDVRETIIQKEIEMFDIKPFDRVDVFKTIPSLPMEDSSERFSLSNEPSFIAGVREKYKGEYNIEVYEPDPRYFLVTKIDQ